MDPFLIDSHCHLHDRSCFTNDQAEQMLVAARENNVRQIVVIGTSHADSLSARDFASAHSDVFWSYGVHPSEAEKSLSSTNFEIPKKTTTPENSPKTTISKNPAASTKIPENSTTLTPVAIGEVGLDYHYQPYDKNAQIRLFEEMLALAKKHNLPLIFHIREAFDDFFPIVDNQHIKRAVIHSFSDNQANLQKSLDRGYYIGVNGLTTFANLPLPPLERTLLETDAPYLTPKPFRGKINQSAYIKHIAEYLAVKLNIPIEKITEETTNNVQTLFQLPQPILRTI